MRNCITKSGSNPDPRTGTPDDCVGPNHRFNAAWSTVRPEPRRPVCNSQPCSRFVQDGGSTFGEIRSHPDLVTPGCEGSLLSYRGAIIFAGPYSTLPGTAVANPGRHNGTVLVSVDDGVRFSRSLLLQPSTFGYSALQCGIPGPEGDCGVLYDCGDGLAFARFHFDDVR